MNKVSYNSRLNQELAKYLDYVVIVEGKKDVLALEALGFTKVNAIHASGVPIRERVEQIAQTLTKKDKICILTDFDKKGKQLYLLLKKEFQNIGAKTDSKLRGILLGSGVSHIEGLDSFMQKMED